MKKAIVIGSGFAGLAAAAFLAKAGADVTVVERHAGPGGRARRFEDSGFTFDMGPSWYWMPDVMDRFFAQFGKKTSDYYSLTRLDPSYRIYFADREMDVPADYEKLKTLFESVESGSGIQLDRFMAEAAYKYEKGVHGLAMKPSLSISEFLDPSLAVAALRMDVFVNMKKHVARFFKHSQLQQLMEFPVLFLGALAQHIPALYSLMNYADIKLGTWYPSGGMYSLVEGMYAVAQEVGVRFRFNCEVKKINVEKRRAVSVSVAEEGAYSLPADVIISTADYHFTETELLEPQYQSYSAAYWDQRQMAPSCLLWYVGLNSRIAGLQHHSLFFDSDFDKHGREIYAAPQWPSDPLFYVSATSVTDPLVAPAGGENLFFLVPVAAGLEGDNEELRQQYFYKVLERFSARVGENVREKIVFQKSFAIKDFVDEYHAFKGNAYGLANTLKQTAIFKPSMRSKKVQNLLFAGQLTVPGPGVPPSLLSGEIAAAVAQQYLQR